MFENLSKGSKGGAGGIIALGVGVSLLYVGTPVILPLVFAFFLFLLLDPWIEFAERRGVGRRVSSTIAIFIAIVFVAAIGFAFYQSVVKIADRMPTYSEKIESVAARIHRKAKEFQDSTDVLFSVPDAAPAPKVQQVQIVGTRSASPVTSYILRGFNSALVLISMAFFIPLISFFMLLEKHYLVTRFREVFRDRALFERSSLEIREMAHKFFIGNFLLGTSMALTFACLFIFLKLEDALALSLFAGFLNLIPAFGAFLGAALPAVQAALQFNGFGPMVAIVVMSIVVHFVANNLILPKILGSRVNLNGTAAMVGFLFWGTLWGIVGLFLAIPLMAILRILLLSSDRLRPYANLISETPVVGNVRLYGSSWLSPRMRN